MLERVAVRAARLANQLPAATRSGTGLAATIHRRAASSSEIERLAKAICGENEDPSLLEKALIIAENELVLRAIAAQKVAVVERVRERSAIALARGDNSLALAKARFLKTQQAYDELAALRDKLLEKYKDKLPPPVLFEKMEEVLPEIELLFPLHLRIFLEDMDSELASKAQGQSWANINRTAEGAGERGEFGGTGGGGSGPHPAGSLRAPGVVSAKTSRLRLHQHQTDAALERCRIRYFGSPAAGDCKTGKHMKRVVVWPNEARLQHQLHTRRRQVH